MGNGDIEFCRMVKRSGARERATCVDFVESMLGLHSNCAWRHARLTKVLLHQLAAATLWAELVIMVIVLHPRQQVSVPVRARDLPV